MSTTTLLPARKAKPISLTALIDVVFILLMFFMLTSSFSRWQALPLALAGEGGVDNGTTPQFLLLHSDSTMSYQRGQQRQDAPLETLLARIDTRQSITLLPAPEVSLQQMVTTLTALKTAGVKVLLGRSHPLAGEDGL